MLIITNNMIQELMNTLANKLAMRYLWEQVTVVICLGSMQV